MPRIAGRAGFALVLFVGSMAAADEIRTLTVCSEGCAFSSMEEAGRAAADGDRIVVDGGSYDRGMILRASDVTVIARHGARMIAALAEEKAAIVVKGSRATIVGLECSDISAPNRNGACIRQEGRDLTLRQVYFHDSEEGVLTAPDTGELLIEDSRFERLGQDGYAHGLYAGPMESVIIRNSRFLSGRSEGHEIKSRAANTLIEDSVVASLDGVDSRLVDVPNGGRLIVRRCLLEKGPASSNREMIGYGLEGIRYEVNEVRLESVTFILDRASAQLYDGSIAPVFDADLQVGGGPPNEKAGIGWVRSRAAANIAPYPDLPERPGASP